MTSPAPSAGTGKVKGNHKLLAGIALMLGVVLTLVLVFNHRGLYRFYRLRQERLRLEQENARLAVENTRLARTIDRLYHDPEMIQDLIRRELNFVKKNEIIFQLPPAVSNQAPRSPADLSAAASAAPRPRAGAAPGLGKRSLPWESPGGSPRKADRRQSRR
jgi:cell division protein FtsB